MASLRCGIGLCAMAAVLTVATLICLSIGNTLGKDTSGFLTGTAIVFVVSFALQLLFLVSRFIADRAQHENAPPTTPSMLEVGRSGTGSRSPSNRVKTVPYARVSPPPPESHASSHASTRTASMDASDPPTSSGGLQSTRSTIYSMASSVEHVVRSASSKTRLISSTRSSRSLRSQRSSRSQRRAASLDAAHHDSSAAASVEDHHGFDSWDTSAVDPQNRQLVTGTTVASATCNGSGNGSRFLETIPASPTTSRSPSPGTPLDRFDLPSPRTAHRSRSFSPATSAHSLALPTPPRRALTFTQQASASESHIHPLFRSDSATPPPMASPRTVVIAAPQAGQVISDRQSIRSLSRMRSGSLPTVSSPLTDKRSFESFATAAQGGGVGGESNKTFSASSENSMRSDDTVIVEEVPERRITPPVPDFILKAGSQSSSSLHMYPARKTPSRDGPRGPGLSALEGASW